MPLLELVVEAVALGFRLFGRFEVRGFGFLNFLI
jgi:hypothetical protein